MWDKKGYICYIFYWNKTFVDNIMQITNDIVKQDTNFTYKQDYRQYYSFIVIQSPGGVSNKNLIF